SHTRSGVTIGCPYIAVGMQSALDSAKGLPRSSSSAFSMLGFLMPADVSRSFNGSTPFARTSMEAQTGDGLESHRNRPALRGVSRPGSTDNEAHAEVETMKQAHDNNRGRGTTRRLLAGAALATAVFAGLTGQASAATTASFSNGV